MHRHNAARLSEVFSVAGWPTDAMVGADAASAAWMIAQQDEGGGDRHVSTSTPCRW
ncbi:MAG: hypothetical protein ABI601_05745 [bacterium]